MKQRKTTGGMKDEGKWGRMMEGQKQHWKERKKEDHTHGRWELRDERKDGTEEERRSTGREKTKEKGSRGISNKNRRIASRMVGTRGRQNRR